MYSSVRPKESEVLERKTLEQKALSTKVDIIKEILEAALELNRALARVREREIAKCIRNKALMLEENEFTMKRLERLLDDSLKEIHEILSHPDRCAKSFLIKELGETSIDSFRDAIKQKIDQLKIEIGKLRKSINLLAEMSKRANKIAEKKPENIKEEGGKLVILLRSVEFRTVEEASGLVENKLIAGEDILEINKKIVTLSETMGRAMKLDIREKSELYLYLEKERKKIDTLLKVIQEKITQDTKKSISISISEAKEKNKAKLKQKEVEVEVASEQFLTRLKTLAMQQEEKRDNERIGLKGEEAQLFRINNDLRLIFKQFMCQVPKPDRVFNKICYICMDEESKNSLFSFPRCGHCFHKSCILGLFNYHVTSFVNKTEIGRVYKVDKRCYYLPSCPYCRSKVEIEISQYGSFQYKYFPH